MNYSILSHIFAGGSVKEISDDKIPSLCSDIRNFLIENVSKTGGHLASNLGVVEMTVALHRVFDSPRDKIVFDVGHQSYVHKILTGRSSGFERLRKKDGISGFPRPSESEHDAFLAGHSSTSVSAALGIATANKLAGNDDFTIAVIGDGALTGGLAFEGINNAGRSQTRLLVVINDNEQSISKNVGALSKYLSDFTSTQKYFNFKDKLQDRLTSFPLIGKKLFNTARRTKNRFKRMFIKGEGNYFENLGFRYFGPIDGHDEEKVEMVFKRVKKLGYPCVVHLKTVKGYGYKKAEENPALYHGVSNFDAQDGITVSNAETFSSNFGRHLSSLAEKNDKICAITAAMTDGVGLSDFAQRYPDRFFDVGIAEGHAATFASGLAINGCKPVFACYSTFLQRSFDQILHDAALQKLPVVLAVDRAGFVGDDGETHQGLFDVSMMLEIPGITIYSPASYAQQDYALERALNANNLFCLRYPKGAESKEYAPLLSFTEDFKAFGCEDAEAVAVSYGRALYNVFEARELADKKVGIIALFKLTDIDYDAIKAVTGDKTVYFYEEGMMTGGVASDFCRHIPCEIHAVTDFVKQGTVDEQYSLCSMDARSIAENINGK